MLEPFIVISIFVGLIFVLLLIGTSVKPIRWIGQAVMKLTIGAIFLFFLNVLGSQIGLHVPINFITSAVSGFLGIPGVLALAIIQSFIIT